MAAYIVRKLIVKRQLMVQWYSMTDMKECATPV